MHAARRRASTVVVAAGFFYLSCPSPCLYTCPPCPLAAFLKSPVIYPKGPPSGRGSAARHFQVFLWSWEGEADSGMAAFWWTRASADELDRVARDRKAIIFERGTIPQPDSFMCLWWASGCAWTTNVLRVERVPFVEGTAPAPSSNCPQRKDGSAGVLFLGP